MPSLDPETLVDRYRVKEMIGSGAMGEVYLAVDEGLGRKVALKILADAHRQNPELRARFGREGRAVAAIQHANVVQVFTIGEHDQRPYIAMEYLAGQDLGSIVRAVGPLDSLAAASAVLDAAQGLEAAARAGMIHRDVKPSNLVRLDAGGVKLTDFGLAKPVERSNDPALTALGVVVGTPDYIAPEQARGDEIDSRVDVYALGCTLFFLLTGRPPFRKGIDAEDKYLKVVARHLRDPAPDARKEAPATDDELAELALAMMRKAPEDRPTYREIIASLERIRARLLSAPAGAPAASPASGESARSRGAALISDSGPTSESERTTVRGQRSTPASRDLPAGASGAGSLGSVPVYVPSRTGRRLLIAFTMVCATVFLTGLGLRLFATPRVRRAAGPPPPDAGPRPAPIDAGVAAVTPPTPPDGMLLVTGAAGQPLFFVDRQVVTHRAYQQLISSHRFPKPHAAKPVTGISHDYAASYARLAGKRLLRAGEWDAALATPGLAPAGMKLWEWVDDGNDAAPDRPARRAPRFESRRPKKGDPSTTFRLARDL